MGRPYEFDHYQVFMIMNDMNVNVILLLYYNIFIYLFCTKYINSDQPLDGIAQQAKGYFRFFLSERSARSSLASITP